MDGRVWVPCWEDNHTRACVLCLPASKMLGFSWLKLLVESLCGDRFSNPFKDLRPVDTDCAPESPIPVESEAEEDSDNDQSISDATSDAKAFLRLVRFVLYLFDAVDLPFGVHTDHSRQFAELAFSSPNKLDGRNLVCSNIYNA